MIRCPFCDRTDGIFVNTADYGFGYGTEFGHYCDGSTRRLWSDESPEAKQRSDEVRSRSRANAEILKRRQGG